MDLEDRNQEDGGGRNGLPPALDRFGPRLERAVSRDLARSSRRTRLVGGAVAVAVVAAAVFAGIAAFGGLGAGGPKGVTPANALDKAAAALETPAGVIVHVHMVGEQMAAAAESDSGDTTNAGTTDAGSVTWSDESWQLTSAPNTRRQIEKGPGSPRAETGVVDGRNALYDAATDTVYTGGDPYDSKGMAGEADGFRQKALEALKSGGAHVAGHVTVDGRDALRIVVSADEEYLVDAQTYDPIEWITRGTSETATLRFVAYEKLPLTPQNEDLVDIKAQHPGAIVDSDPAHYQQAMSRLFPNG
jgi:hypothetical protein